MTSNQATPENKTPEIAIRPATPADAEAMGRLGALLVAEHHAFDSARFLEATPTTPRAYADFLRGQLQKPDRVVLVAHHGDMLAGYVYGGIEGTDYMALRGPAGVLYDLVVDLPYRRQGIGKKLLDTALALLGEKGAPRAVLFTADKNVVAQRLFDASGFRKTMVEMTLDLVP